MHLSQKQLPFWLITIAILIGLPGYTLIQDGMFMDAMLYTSVAHNEAQGIGTFWFPQFSKLNLNTVGANSFHEQPPLAFGIQSIFFRILGDSMYVERFYVFLTTCITAFLIHLLWRQVFKSREELRRMSWLPIFIWITVPTVFWGASNNVNENTMGIFTLAAALVAFIGLQKQHGASIGHWIFSGTLIFLATMSKGFPGFFPVCVPILYWLTVRKISFKKAFQATLIITLLPILVYVILFQVSPSKESLSIYLFKRALQRISEDPTTSNRFMSMESLFMDLLPALGILLICFLIATWKKVKYNAVADKRVIAFFMLLGLAGSAPLMLTMVQKAFYLLPCFPFFGIGFGLILAPLVLHLQSGMDLAATGFKIFRGVSIFLLIVSVAVVAAMKGKTGRDQGILHDIRIVSRIVPAYSAVTVTRRSFYFDWELQCYMMRYYNISNDFKPEKSNRYVLLDKSEKADMDLSDYVKMELPLERYDMYRLKK
jgi:4-amino-4-deoxy-L-arabinose transferase-like glycosyltransferase